ncbi:MAG: hypothetical protein V9F06_03175 [Thermomicrobiales bacterium]
MKSRVSRARTKLQEVLQIAGEADYGPDAVSSQVTTLAASSAEALARAAARRRRNQQAIARPIEGLYRGRRRLSDSVRRRPGRPT